MDEERVQLAVKLILVYLESTTLSTANAISKKTHEMHMQYMAQLYYSTRDFFKPAFTYIVTVRLYAY